MLSSRDPREACNHTTSGEHPWKDEFLLQSQEWSTDCHKVTPTSQFHQ
jgi:hypothetical protein